MLLSKRPDMFLPEQWPSYFSKAKGCKVWDLDGNEYVPDVAKDRCTKFEKDDPLYQDEASTLSTALRKRWPSACPTAPISPGE